MPHFCLATFGNVWQRQGTAEWRKLARLGVGTVRVGGLWRVERGQHGGLDATVAAIRRCK